MADTPKDRLEEILKDSERRWRDRVLFFLGSQAEEHYDPMRPAHQHYLYRYFVVQRQGLEADHETSAAKALVRIYSFLNEELDELWGDVEASVREALKLIELLFQVLEGEAQGMEAELVRLRK